MNTTKKIENLYKLRTDLLQAAHSISEQIEQEELKNFESFDWDKLLSHFQWRLREPQCLQGHFSETFIYLEGQYPDAEGERFVNWLSIESPDIGEDGGAPRSAVARRLLEEKFNVTYLSVISGILILGFSRADFPEFLHRSDLNLAGTSEWRRALEKIDEPIQKLQARLDWFQRVKRLLVVKILKDQSRREAHE